MTAASRLCSSHVDSSATASGTSRTLPSPLRLIVYRRSGNKSTKASGMSERPVLLKVLLRQRHWQHYGTFRTQYDKAARAVDPTLVGTWPSRAQLHRWLSGRLKGLPYPDHCRVLEQLFPDYSAQTLFSPCPDDLLSSSGNRHDRSGSASVSPESARRPEPDLAPVPAVGVRELVEQAFMREQVRIDFAGFSGETLHSAVQEPLDKIRIGTLKPRSIEMRLLLLDTSEPLPLPCLAEDLSDDPDFRARAQRIVAWHTQAIVDTLEELDDLGLVDNVSVQVRVHHCPPSFKLFILNDEEALFGFYPITRHTVLIDDRPRTIFDLMGKDAVLFRYRHDDPPGMSAAYIQQARAWFDSMWSTVGRQHDQ